MEEQSENFGIALATLTAIVSVLISGIVSYIIAVNLKKKDFRNEYYRLILEKRIDIYERLQAAMTSLFIIDTEDEWKTKFHPNVVDNMELARLIFEFSEIQKKGSLWLSDKLSYQVGVLMHYLTNNFSGEEKFDTRKKKALELYQSIQEKRKIIDVILIDDLRELHEIETFLKERPSRFNQVNKKYIS